MSGFAHFSVRSFIRLFKREESFSYLKKTVEKFVKQDENEHPNPFIIIIFDCEQRNIPRICKLGGFFFILVFVDAYIKIFFYSLASPRDDIVFKRA